MLFAGTAIFTGSKMDTGVDSALDTVGVRLEELFYCGSCNTKMEKINLSKYKCSKCGQVYEDT